MKELGLLFGNTAHAAATTLAAFFIGLAGGGWWVGRKTESMKRPLAVYGWLEIGVSVTALLYFALLALYRLIYPSLFGALEDVRPVFTVVKFILGLTLLFPAAFCMGGTLPTLAAHLIRSRDALGKTTPVLYAVNTVGAATGAFLAGFWLPRAFGFTSSYWIAFSLTMIIGVVAIAAGHLLPIQGSAENPKKKKTKKKEKTPESVLPFKTILILAAVSGFVTLGLEVLWTRMFAQTLHNSVYTYATILVTFLFALGIGAAIASWLARRYGMSLTVLRVLLVIGGVLVAATPFQFYLASERYGYLGESESWGEYIWLVFRSAIIVLLPAVVVLGVIFPYLMKLSEPYMKTAGRMVGNLAAINTLAAVVGSVAAGFLMLEWFGLWVSIRLMAGVCLIAAAVLGARWLPAAGLVLLLSVLDAGRLPTVFHNPKTESVVEKWEGSGAIVAVVRRNDGSLRIKVNNFYALGNSSAAESERFQSHLPLLVHPEPKDVFYLGMGTGITAGGSMQHDLVESVTVTELVPDVIDASEKHFEKYLNGLFEDKRVRVVAEDGRHYLAATREEFDVIIADLFIPWRAGVGSLYTVEHYERTRSRLREGGVFAQWVPMYQVTDTEFSTIVATMLEAFPQVTVWRGDFYTERSIVCLLGHRDATPLDMETFRKRSRAFAKKSGNETFAGNENVAAHLSYYCGSLRPGESIQLRDSPISTDDYPLLEYEAPINHRKEKAGKTQWFTGEQLVKWMETIGGDAEKDPWLANGTEIDQIVVESGHALHSLKIAQSKKDKEIEHEAFERFQDLIQKLELR
ncbi:MAG: fused MFS/spermidine synthase [Verrucomicrobiota bacterium]